LIELIVIVVVLGVLTAIAVPNATLWIDQAKATADSTTVRTMNSVTTLYRSGLKTADPFDDKSVASDALMQKLILGGYMSGSVTPQTRDGVFTWDVDQQTWRVYIGDKPVALSPLGDTFTDISTLAVTE